MPPELIADLPLLQDVFTPAWDKWAELVGLDNSWSTSSDVKFMNSAVLTAALIDGQGVAPVRRLLLIDDLKAGRLTRLDNSAIPLESSLYFLCRTSDQNKEPVRRFKDWLFSIPLSD